jgi:hypothetical protein
VIVPVEAAGLAGTLGGIAEITRAVFAGEPERTAQRRGAVPAVGSRSEQP